MNYVFGIPSYQRAGKVTTVGYLRSLGYEKENILVSVQTADDLAAYKELYDNDAVIVYRQGKCVSDNRNTLLMNAPKDTAVVMLDDDISYFAYVSRAKMRPKDGAIVSKAALDNILQRLLELSKNNGCKVFGIYPVPNPFFAYNPQHIQYNKLIEGTFICVVDTTLRFDPHFTIKEDYELCCRTISRGARTLRYNRIIAIAKHYSNDGGCKEQWDKNEELANELVFRYPDIVRASHRKGEIIGIL